MYTLLSALFLTLSPTLSQGADKSMACGCSPESVTWPYVEHQHSREQRHGMIISAILAEADLLHLLHPFMSARFAAHTL